MSVIEKTDKLKNIVVDSDKLVLNYENASSDTYQFSKVTQVRINLSPTIKVLSENSEVTGTDDGGGGGSDSGGGTPTPTPTPSGANYAPTPTVYSTATYTGGNGIKYVITNNTGEEARFTGKVILNLSKNPNDWSQSTQANANIHGPQSAGSFDRNDIIIAPGRTYESPLITEIDAIYPQYAGTNFTDGSWYLMNTINNLYSYPIFLYTREYSRSRNSVSGSQNMYVAAPTQNAILQKGYTYYLNLYWKNPNASLDPDKSGSRYVILGNGQTDLMP